MSVNPTDNASHVKNTRSLEDPRSWDFERSPDRFVIVPTVSSTHHNPKVPQKIFSKAGLPENGEGCNLESPAPKASSGRLFSIVRTAGSVCYLRERLVGRNLSGYPTNRELGRCSLGPMLLFRLAELR